MRIHITFRKGNERAKATFFTDYSELGVWIASNYKNVIIEKLEYAKEDK